MTNEFPQVSDSPAAGTAFLLDVMLGKLAVYLRLCGYDVMYIGDYELEDDDVIARLGKFDDRIIFSRDRSLVSQTAPQSELFKTRSVREQLEEVQAAGFHLEIAEPPRRCGRCNGRLVSECDRKHRPEYAPADSAITCWRCVRCDQYFWKGTHWSRMKSVLNDVRQG